VRVGKKREERGPSLFNPGKTFLLEGRRTFFVGKGGRRKASPKSFKPDTVHFFKEKRNEKLWKRKGTSMVVTEKGTREEKKKGSVA